MAPTRRLRRLRCDASGVLLVLHLLHRYLGIDFRWEVSYIIRCHFKDSRLLTNTLVDIPRMKKRVEVAALSGLCIVSLVLGLVSGLGASQVGTALFFYLLAIFFFLAIFRPHSL